MARIPTAENVRETPVENVRAIVQPNAAAFGAVGQGVQRLAQAGNQLVQVIDERQRQADEYAASSRFIDFDLEQERALEEAQRGAGENPKGFSDAFGQSYTQAAKSFVEGLPESVRPKYDMMLRRRGGEYARKASSFERDASDKYHVNDLSTRLEGLTNLTTTKPDAYQDNIARGVTLIDTAPIPATTKMKLRTQYARETEALALRSKIERGEGLDQIITDLRGGPEPLDDMENPETRAKPFDGAAVPQGPSSQRKPVSAFSPAVNAAIEAAAQRNGLDPALLSTFVRIESGGRPNAETGSYKGLLQLSQSEFRKHGGQGDIFDPEANLEAGAAKIKAEAAEFQRKFGRPPTPVDLYLVHQQGEGGYANHMAHPNAPAWQNMAATAEGRQKGSGWAKQAIWGNIPDDMKRQFGSVDNVTSQQFMDVWREKVDRLGGGSSVAAASSSAPEYAGPYRHISADQRLDLLRLAQAKVRAGFEGMREQLKQQLDDDVESIRRTGVSRQPDVETAQRVLEPNQVNAYRLKRQEAEMEYGAMKDLSLLPEGELQQRLESIKPKPGEELYEMKAKIFDKVSRAVEGENGIRNLREHDPARAVDDVPEVRDAVKFARENPDDPEGIQRLVQARLDAQEKVSVPAGLRRPITKTEARVIVAPLKGLEGQALREKGADWLMELQNKYGSYANAVARDAIEMALTRDKDLADEVTGILNSTLRGQPVSASSVRRMESIQEINLAMGAFEPMQQFAPMGRGGNLDAPQAATMADAAPMMGGNPLPDAATPMQVYGMRQPPKGAIDLLMSNPALAPDFDRTFGQGSAARIMAEQTPKPENMRSVTVQSSEKKK